MPTSDSEIVQLIALGISKSPEYAALKTANTTFVQEATVNSAAVDEAASASDSDQA
jgi:hypothetical protein